MELLTGLRPLGLLVVAALAASAAIPSTNAVAPGAQLYIVTLGDHDRDVWVRLSPTGDAAHGNVTILVRLLVESYNGTGPKTLLEQAASVEIPAPSPERRFNATSVHFELPSLLGVYRLRASVYADAEGTGRPWDEYSRLIPFGTPPANLAHGWGRIQASSVSSLDLTESGAPALTILDDAGAPSTWDVEAAVAPWESKTSRGWTFTLRAWKPADENASAHFTIDTSVLRGIIQAGPDQELRTQQGEEGTVQVGTNTIQVDFEPRPFPPDTWWTRSVFASVSAVFAQPVSDIATRGWYNGYQTRVNLTMWDLDGDGSNDILFWQNTATSDSQARAQSEAERRSSPAKLAVHAIVNESLTGRSVDFEVFRVDGSHEGAWMEIRSPEAVIRQALSSPYMDPNASLEYELSLPEPEGFVEERESTTWVWFGHFSPQHLRIVAAFDLAKVPWADADGDGVADADDTCPGHDDRVDVDHDGVPDACESTSSTPSSAWRIPGKTADDQAGGASTVPSLAFPGVVLAFVAGFASRSRRRSRG